LVGPRARGVGPIGRFEGGAIDIAIFNGGGRGIGNQVAHPASTLKPYFGNKQSLEMRRFAAWLAKKVRRTRLDRG